MRIVRNILIILAALIIAAGCIIGIVSFRAKTAFWDTAQRLWGSILPGASFSELEERGTPGIAVGEFSLDAVPEWDGSTASVEVNFGFPYFSEEEKEIPDGMIFYSNLDSLARCGPVTASVCSEIMPEEERDDTEERFLVTPSGYAQKQYPEDVVEYGYLYNRCHLLGWQLGGDASAVNLIAGTRSLNMNGMLPYENQTARYVRTHSLNHVLYRVTPIFAGYEQNCRGVLMEAYSLEDHGDFHFCVYVYNEQPGITIDHRDGSSWEND